LQEITRSGFIWCLCVCGCSLVCKSLYGCACVCMGVYGMDVYGVRVYGCVCRLWVDVYAYVCIIVLCTYSRVPRGTTKSVPTCTAYMNAMWNGGRSSISNIIPDLSTSLRDVTSGSSFAALLSLSSSASSSLVQLAEVRHYIMPFIYLLFCVFPFTLIINTTML